MGCINSRPSSDEDVVRRYKARKRFMKQAVMHRHAFALAHYAYLHALRNAGAALRQFAEGETATRSEDSSATPTTGGRTLPPPPPPPPHLVPASRYHVNRSFSLPADEASPTITSSSASQRDGAETWSPGGSSSKRSDTPPPPSPQKSSWDFFNPFRPSSPPSLKPTSTRHHAPYSTGYAEDAVPALEVEEEYGAITRWEHPEVRGGLASAGVGDLLDIVKQLDEWFLKASSSGAAASTVLETRKDHFMSVFPDSKKGGNTPSHNVFSSLTPWSWAKMPFASDELDRIAESDAVGSHALTLERLRAWEKKLFEEVKSGEALRSEHQKKCTLLRNQEAKGEDAGAIEKTRATIKRLHSLILVASQGVGTTTAAIKKLRDEELYPQLAELVEGLAYMWRTMHECHSQQKQVALRYKEVEAQVVRRGEEEATTEHHRHATVELEKELSSWYECFCKLAGSHREYMGALGGWAKLSTLEISITDEAANKENEHYEEQQPPLYTTTMSPPHHHARPAAPKTVSLCEEWQKALDRLPDKVASEAIKSLVAVVHALVVQQAEELKQKKKVKLLTKKLEKKVASLHAAEKKQLDAPPLQSHHAISSSRLHRSPADHHHHQSYYEEQFPYERDVDQDSMSTDDSERMTEDLGALAVRDAFTDRKAEVEALRAKLGEQRLKLAKCVQDTRVLTMNNLQTGLPGVFEAMTGFSAVCGQAFHALSDASKSTSHYY